jgi:hypothetical protein
MQTVPPELFIFGTEQSGPEPEAQSCDNLVPRLLTLRSQAFTNNSYCVSDVGATRSWHEKPGDSAELLPVMLLEATVQSVAEQDFQVPNNLKRGG